MDWETFPTHILLQSLLRSPGKAIYSDSNQKKSAGGRVARKTEWEVLLMWIRGFLRLLDVISTPDIRTWDGWVVYSPKAKRIKHLLSRWNIVLDNVPSELKGSLGKSLEILGLEGSTYYTYFLSESNFITFCAKTSFCRHVIIQKALGSELNDKWHICVLPSFKCSCVFFQSFLDLFLLILWKKECRQQNIPSQLKSKWCSVLTLWKSNSLSWNALLTYPLLLAHKWEEFCQAETYTKCLSDGSENPSCSLNISLL